MALLQFEFGEDDLVAFADHHARTAPTWAKRMRFLRWLGAGMVALGAAGQWILDANPVSNALWASLGLFWLLFYPAYARRRNRRWHLRNYRQGKADVLYGRTSLKLTSSTLNLSKGGASSITPITDLDRIEENATHVFIYLNPIAAIVIPRAKVIEGNVESFVSSLRLRRDRDGAAV